MSNEDRKGGVQVMVTLGVEKFAPVQYQSFDVGPFSVTLTTQPGETVQEAMSRGLAMLYIVQRADFEARSKAFLERVRLAAGAARSAR